MIKPDKSRLLLLHIGATAGAIEENFAIVFG
jgi:hypothetical protein